MGTPLKKSATLFLVCAVFFAIAIIVVTVPDASLADHDQVESLDFDHHGQDVFDAYNGTTSIYMSGNSTARTLDYYYSLRQYPGSPPFIPHELSDENGYPYECLSCHARGGFTQSMDRHAPVTPHPQHSECRQCHAKPLTESLFREIDWMSVQPPILGRSELPGSPPPIPHALQMRGNCIACHVGPGAVVTIRVEHPMRGNCRQCHVPETVHSVFESLLNLDQ